MVISSSAAAPALEKAAKLGIPNLAVPSKGTTVEAYSKALFSAATRAGAEAILLAGFLKKLHIPEAWEGRVLNIHPSLLPAFGGKGYYGHRVHQAVLDRGVQITGCTVHLVDNQYDNGPILLQRSCPVEAGDSADSLAARVFEVEREAFPEALRIYLRGLGT